MGQAAFGWFSTCLGSCLTGGFTWGHAGVGAVSLNGALFVCPPLPLLLFAISFAVVLCGYQAPDSVSEKVCASLSNCLSVGWMVGWLVGLVGAVWLPFCFLAAVWLLFCCLASDWLPFCFLAAVWLLTGCRFVVWLLSGCCFAVWRLTGCYFVVWLLSGFCCAAVRLMFCCLAAVWLLSWLLSGCCLAVLLLSGSVCCSWLRTLRRRGCCRCCRRLTCCSLFYCRTATGNSNTNFFRRSPKFTSQSMLFCRLFLVPDLLQI